MILKNDVAVLLYGEIRSWSVLTLFLYPHKKIIALYFSRLSKPSTSIVIFLFILSNKHKHKLIQILFSFMHPYSPNMKNYSIWMLPVLIYMYVLPTTPSLVTQNVWLVHKLSRPRLHLQPFDLLVLLHSWNHAIRWLSQFLPSELWKKMTPLHHLLFHHSVGWELILTPEKPDISMK